MVGEAREAKEGSQAPAVHRSPSARARISDKMPDAAFRPEQILFRRKLVLPQSTRRARLSCLLWARLRRNSGHSGSQVSQVALWQDRPTGARCPAGMPVLRTASHGSSHWSQGPREAEQVLAGEASAMGLPPHSCQGDLREGSVSHSSGSFLGRPSFLWLMTRGGRLLSACPLPAPRLLGADPSTSCYITWWPDTQCPHAVRPWKGLESTF